MASWVVIIIAAEPFFIKRTVQMSRASVIAAIRLARFGCLANSRRCDKAKLAEYPAMLEAQFGLKLLC